MKTSKVELEAVASAARDVELSATTADEESSTRANGALQLTFFHNSKGAPVADLYMGERRLLATTHPATIVGAMFAMKRTGLTVVTSIGSHTGVVRFLAPNEAYIPLVMLRTEMELYPERCQFLHLAPTDLYVPLLQGLDLFAREDWHEPNDVCDEYIRAAYHHLPEDVIRRPLLKPAPKGWKKTLKRRNGWIYYPFC